MLIGDVRKKGKYYSLIKDLTYFGDLESHIIKIQNNCMSDNKMYSNSFIPIKHEHLLIFKKNCIWSVAIKQTKNFVKDLKTMINATWRDIIQAAIENYDGKATTDQIYDILADSEKARNNNNVRAKIRQVLNTHNNFKKCGEEWVLNVS